MNSQSHGNNTSTPEVTHVSSHGIWLLSQQREYFLSYEDFPWFKDVPLRSVLNVEQPGPDHFFWPELDVDLSVAIIEHPERFPLKTGTRSPAV